VRRPRLAGRLLAGRGGHHDARRLAATAQDDRVAEPPVTRLPLARALEHRLRGEQTLAALLGELAQPRRLVDGIPDHRVLEPMLGADVPRHRGSGRDPDARIDLGELPP